MKANTSGYPGYRFPSEITSHAVWLYYRFCLSFRDVEYLLAKRGETWHLDELFVTIQGERQYLWRAAAEHHAFGGPRHEPAPSLFGLR